MHDPHDQQIAFSHGQLKADAIFAQREKHPPPNTSSLSLSNILLSPATSSRIFSFLRHPPFTGPSAIFRSKENPKIAHALPVCLYERKTKHRPGYWQKSKHTEKMSYAQVMF